MTEKSTKKRILVAMSGGVDSSVAALLLQESGFQAEGAIMLLEGMKQESIDLAEQVAQYLHIPFHRFDLRKAHQESVIDYFVQEYQRGRTPNPCVVCNKMIKFGLFMKKAQEMGIKNIATGHYAGIGRKNGRYLLKKGRDKNEQSYFLYRLKQDQLSNIIFPLARYTKDRVRGTARKHRLPTAQRRKSQDVCFIPDRDYVSFLANRISANPGPILDRDGNMVGDHKGIINFTIGQRHGIGISHKYPYYVTKIDAQKNAIYIGEKQEVYKRACLATDLNFIPFDSLDRPIRVKVKVRYFSKPSEATIEPVNHDNVKVTFIRPQWAITPGQSAVFLRRDLVVGGGVIDKVVD